MPELLRMPEVATGAEEAAIAGWPVPENRPYAAGEVIVHVETAKAAVDVEAENDGVIFRTLVPAGGDVQVGDPIALIGRPGETLADIEAELARLGIAVALDGHAVAVSPSLTDAALAVPAAPQAGADRAGGGRVFASPLARRLASQADIDIRQLVGTGPGGRIVRADVTGAIIAAQAQQAALAQDPATHSPAVPRLAEGEFTEEPHSKLRRVIATRLTHSKATVPHFYLRAGVRVDRLLALREQLNHELPVRVSINDLILKAVAKAHTDVPDANVVWTETGLRRHHSADIGIAIASPKGLVTPVVTGVDRLGMAALAEATRDLAHRAAEGRLKQHELEGGTSMVSNLGMYGTEEFTAIINPPHSSILAVGAVRPEAAVNRHGRIKARTTIRVVLSVDHRAIDGALAAQWMAAFREAVERPLRLLV